MEVTLDLDRLLEIAEAANKREPKGKGPEFTPEWEIWGKAQDLFDATFDPPTVRALLLRLKRLEAVAEAADSLVRIDRGLEVVRRRPDTRLVEMIVGLEAYEAVGEALAALDEEER